MFREARGQSSSIVHDVMAGVVAVISRQFQNVSDKARIFRASDQFRDLAIGGDGTSRNFFNDCKDFVDQRFIQFFP